MDPFSAMLFALAVTWYGSRSGAVRAVRSVRDNHRERKTSRPEPRPAPAGIKAGHTVSAGLTGGVLAVRDFRTGWRAGWRDGRDKAHARRDAKRDEQATRPERRSWIDQLLNRMSPADRAKWAEARTLDDVGERTAQWLEGDINSQPGYQAGFGPASETQELIPVLAHANRRGFITDTSQPGVDDGDGWRQRAGVSGFADPETADRVQRAAEDAGLIVVRSAPGELLPPSQVVTEMDGRPYTAFGPLRERDFRIAFGGLDPAAMDALRGAEQVTVVDPEWGRNDVLWPALSRAVDPDTPVPDTPVKTETPEPSEGRPAPVSLTKETSVMPATATAEVQSLPELIGFLEQIENDAQAELEDAQARETRAKKLASDIETVLGQLSKFELGNTDLNVVGGLLDPTASAEKAATIAVEAAEHIHAMAQNAAAVLLKRHQQMQEAADATPEPASMDFYKNGQNS